MPLIPLHDRNPLLYVRYHYVTLGLIVACAVVFLADLGATEREQIGNVLGYGLIPARLFEDAQLPAGLPDVNPLITLISYQFIHGGWSHIIFNMLFLWVFGDNVEDAMGHGRFLVFFLLCGVIAGFVHAAVDPSSNLPTVGASGSVSGILGAYVMLHPRARILVLAFSFIPLRLPALLAVFTWFAQDILWATFGAPPGNNVAFWAHLGGAAAGMVLITVFRRPEVKLFHKPPSPWGR